MKNILLLFITSLLAAMSPLSAADGRALAEQGDSAYAADDFKQAIAAYEQTVNDGYTSSELLYNLGNAYYRDGRVGKAIVAYERALKLDPTNNDARFNLKFVKSTIVDRPTESTNGLELFFTNLRDLLTPNGWAWFGVAMFAIFIILAATYIFTTPVMLRKIGFFGAIFALPISVVMFVLATRAANLSTAHNEAIVSTPSMILSTAPRVPKDRNEEVALLHEGTKIEVIDSLNVTSDSLTTRWYKVELPAGHQGWTSSDHIEII